MTDLATLNADLDALKAARRTGARRIRIGDREVEFRGDAEIAAAIAATEAEIASAQGVRPVRNVVLRSKGWT